MEGKCEEVLVSLVTLLEFLRKLETCCIICFRLLNLSLNTTIRLSIHKFQAVTSIVEIVYASCISDQLIYPFLKREPLTIIKNITSYTERHALVNGQ